MKELKQIGYVHFYITDECFEIYSIVEDLCKGLEQYVSAVRCQKDYADIEFKYSPYVTHYSIKCGFNKHHMLLMDTYHPLEHVKSYGIPFVDWQRYDDALHESQQISILQNKVLKNIKCAFLKANTKK